MMWKDAYLIGNEQIDTQHKQLIGALEDLLKCARSNRPEKCRQTVQFMQDYAVNHFAAEEILQKQIGFPLAAEHHRLHEAFKTRLHGIGLELMRSGYSGEPAEQLIHMLTEWWIYHIIKEDKKMVEYL